MRRGLATLVLGLSLWLGSLAWSGFVLTRTVLDPDRSRDIAESLYDDEAVRDQIVSNVADGLEAALPPGAVDRATAEAAARSALESSAVEALLVDSLVATHGAFLGDGTAPTTVDPGAFGAAAREALVQSRPELDGMLPAAPSLPLRLPTDNLPDAGPLRELIERVVPMLAAVAAAGAVLALVVTSDRPAVLRRAGFWATGVAAAVLAFAFLLPAIATAVLPDQARIVAALVGAMAAETKVPALGMAASGLALAGSSFLLPRGRSRGGSGAGAAVTGGSRTGPGVVPSLGAHQGGRPLPSAAAGTASRPDRFRNDAGDGFATRAQAPVPDPHPGYPSAPPAPAPSASTASDSVWANPSAAGAASGPSTRAGATVPGARWVDGTGWVLEPSTPIPPDARWVPGVGYVVDG